MKELLNQINMIEILQWQCAILGIHSEKLKKQKDKLINKVLKKLFKKK